MIRRGRTPPFRAAVFDMDGVLTDSEPAFFAAVNDVLARYGAQVTLEQYRPFIGAVTTETWRGMKAIFGLSRSVDELSDEFEAPLMERLREPRGALPGARELIERLRARGVPVALCTASFSRWVEPILAGAGLTGMFDAMSMADMVPLTKPHPAPYLLAAKLLGVAPDECIAVEDSANGIASALGAGMYVVQLRATSTAAAPVDGVHQMITSLGEFPEELLFPAAGSPA